MNIDFSTITPIGLFALFIICLALVIVLFFFIRAIKIFRIKTENATVEIGKTSEQIKQSITGVKEGGISMSRDIVKKQSNLAKHHVSTISGDLRKLIYQYHNLTKEEKTIAHLLVALFTAELKYQVLNNFTENHIGNNDIEIEEYTRVRAREYTAFAKAFFEDYDWTIPNHNLKDTLDELPDDYFYTKLFIIYKDGKELERHIKGGK